MKKLLSDIAHSRNNRCIENIYEDIRYVVNKYNKKYGKNKYWKDVDMTLRYFVKAKESGRIDGCDLWTKNYFLNRKNYI